MLDPYVVLTAGAQPCDKSTEVDGNVRQIMSHVKIWDDLR
jgi:hypothetical protein